MRYSTQIKSISYLKAKAAEILHDLAKQRRPLVITQNGEAKAVLQDVVSYEETQETLALLKILALGQSARSMKARSYPWPKRSNGCAQRRPLRDTP